MIRLQSLDKGSRHGTVVKSSAAAAAAAADAAAADAADADAAPAPAPILLLMLMGQNLLSIVAVAFVQEVMISKLTRKSRNDWCVRCYEGRLDC